MIHRHGSLDFNDGSLRRVTERGEKRRQTHNDAGYGAPNDI